MSQPRSPSSAELPTRLPTPQQPATARHRAAQFWLNVLFDLTTHAPWLVRAIRRPIVALVVVFSRKVRQNTAANARRLLQRSLTSAEGRAFARQVVGSFYDFVYDIGRSVRTTRLELESRLDSIEGENHYIDARSLKKGAIVVTAHMGSFEVGMVALLKHEQSGRVHVVFKQDQAGGFEALRTKLRRQLGVLEAPLDEGWTIWMRLRDALYADDVVLLQGDRCMPGQKGLAMPVLGGHIMLPTGPVKLAMATESPIVPVYSIRQPDGRVKIVVDEPIHVEPHGDIEPPMRKIAASLERMLRTHPNQWLLLEKAFTEDNDPAGAPSMAVKQH